MAGEGLQVKRIQAFRKSTYCEGCATMIQKGTSGAWVRGRWAFCAACTDAQVPEAVLAGHRLRALASARERAAFEEAHGESLSGRDLEALVAGALAVRDHGFDVEPDPEAEARDRMEVTSHVLSCILSPAAGTGLTGDRCERVARGARCSLRRHADSIPCLVRVDGVLPSEAEDDLEDLIGEERDDPSHWVAVAETTVARLREVLRDLAQDLQAGGGSWLAPTYSDLGRLLEAVHALARRSPKNQG